MREWKRKLIVAGLTGLLAPMGLALDLPWEKEPAESTSSKKGTDPASSPVPPPTPRPELNIPESESSLFPGTKAGYVGGTTLRIGALVIACPPGWYRGGKRDEDDEEAYLFACVPEGLDKPACQLRIEYDTNLMDRGPEQVPDFLAICRKSLEEDGAWKAEPLQIGARPVQCLRDTDPANGESLLLLQVPLKTHVPTIYVLVPRNKAQLPAEALAFIKGISQNN